MQDHDNFDAIVLSGAMTLTIQPIKSGGTALQKYGFSKGLGGESIGKKGCLVGRSMM